MIEQIEATLRRLLRLPPKPSTDAQVTPFVKQMRDVRREALQQERKRQRTNPLSNAVWPERPKGSHR